MMKLELGSINQAIGEIPVKIRDFKRGHSLEDEERIRRICRGEVNQEDIGSFNQQTESLCVSLLFCNVDAETVVKLACSLARNRLKLIKEDARDKASRWKINPIA